MEYEDRMKIIHVGHYAGWPTIALAIRQYAEVLKEDAGKAQASAR
jgi:hypothetical protein